MGHMNNMDLLVLNGWLAEFMQRAISETFVDAFQISTRPETWSIGRHLPMAIDSLDVAQIVIKQEDVQLGTFVAAFSHDILIDILALNGGSAVDDQVLVDDAAAEITNMLYGMFKTTVNRTGYHLSIGIPTPLHEKKAFIEQYEEAEKLVVPFLADGHQCRIIIAQHH